MDVVSEGIAKHGNIWSLQVNKDMIEAYEPLHAAGAKDFEGKVEIKKAIKYGDDSRHRLDVYSPKGDQSDSLPVVVFIHGGGFVGGDNDVSNSMHGNIANYFVANGCICVLATYRLVPKAHFPEGADDVTNALIWTHQNIAKYRGDPSKLVAVGQSSGGAHIAMAACLGKLAKVPVKGLVLMSAPFSYDLSQARRYQSMAQYYETEEKSQIMSKTAVALLENGGRDNVAPLRIKIMVAELDSAEIKEGNRLFMEAMKERGVDFDVFIMEGHNHISNTYAIGLPEDKTGPEILSFVKK